MQVSVKGKQMDVGDALRSHVGTALDALVGKYFGNAMEAQAIFAREAHYFRCELAVHVGRDILVNSHGEGADAYAAFDAAADRVDKRLRRQKGRLRRHHAREPETTLPATSYVLRPEEPEEHVEADGEEKPVIVAEIASEVPSLSVGDAVMRLDLSNEPALLFRNRAHGGVNLVYRRADVNIGWVDPDYRAAKP